MKGPYHKGLALGLLDHLHFRYVKLIFNYFKLFLCVIS